MNQFLEDFDDNELRDFFLGQPRELPPVCAMCHKPIHVGRDSPCIALESPNEGKLSFHGACFDDLAKSLKKKAVAPGRSRTGPASRK